jgi:type IV pilus assembly protein PilX
MHNPNKQSGVVLIMTLIILLIVTLLGTSSIQMTSLLERMSRNATDTSSAFSAAEAALKAAEANVELETSTMAYAANANGKYESQGVDVTPRWETATTWTAPNAITATYSGSVNPPSYIIEFVQAVRSGDDQLNLDNVGGDAGSDITQIFRITAQGKGKTTAAKIYLQSTYGKKF